MSEKKLTPKQAEVMTWLTGRWQPYVSHGAAVYVNGRRLCNLDTMVVLERRGFAEKVGRYQWRVTEKGGAYMKNGGQPK